jgi:hypothetical protein
MPRIPCPRATALENQAFLRHLRATGNAREAARLTGLSRTRFTKRRAKDPAFAADWDAALALAEAELAPPKPPAGSAAARLKPEDARPVLVCTGPHGRVQLRRSPAHAKLTRAHEQRFLLALSATANVRLSAAAAGLSHATFYARKRRHRGFAREWRAALSEGYDRVEAAALAAAAPESHADDDWSHNDPPDLPPLTADQAIQLLHLHQKEARLQAEPPHLKRRRGEARDAHSERLAAMHEARIADSRETFRRAEAMRWMEGRGSPYHRWVILPDLAQVGGWSKADPAKEPHRPGRPLFGGWRIEDWEEGKG